MTPTRLNQPGAIEARWPAMLAIAGVLVLLALLPARVRLFPSWAPYITGMGLILPMAGTWLSGGDARWRRVERVTTLAFSLLAEMVTLMTLAYLIREMLARPEDFTGIQLFTSSVGAWVTNVLAFSLVYWWMDCGGPDARANGSDAKPDWLFPQSGMGEAAPADWRPTYADYLFVAFTAAAAFSPADALPLTRRAKLLTMVESTVSLATLVVVASRAIGLLG